MNKLKTQNRKITSYRTLISILILLLILALGLIAYLSVKETPTAIISKSNETLQAVDETNQLRVRVNTSITVENGTMQNLCFENLNEGRLLQCKIKLDGDKDYIYQSQKIKEHEIIEADVVDDKNMSVGTHQGIAEIYAYDMNGEMTKQTNVKISLVKS